MPKILKFSRATLLEINRLAQSAPIHKIVRGKNYLYFALQPTQEIVSLKSLCQKPNLRCYSVKNFKGSIIGYVVQLRKTPEDINISEFGVSIFYSKPKKIEKTEKINYKYRNLKVSFSDTKFRSISFGSMDHFFSVKWRSNNPVD